VQLCDEDGRLEADGAHPRAILQVPQHDLPVLPRAEEVAVVGRPAQRLHLARVAAELARDAVGLDVEDDDYAVVLQRNQRESHAKAWFSRTRPDASRSPRWLKRIDVAWPLPTRCESLHAKRAAM
jgi:hypothetical protein